MTFDLWGLVPKEEDDVDVWRVGLQENPHNDAINMPAPFWFAGYGEHGERRWVKCYNDAMTFPDKDEAIKLMDEMKPSGREGSYLFVQIRKKTS